MNKSDELNKDIPSGIGLKNVRQRLAIAYVDNYVIDIVSSDEKYSVKLELNM